jgi:hypothetical protein
MAMLDPNKAWSLFMSDPADFLIVGAFIFGIAWWLRGFIHKERLLLSNDKVEKAQREAADIGQKLIVAETRNAELLRKIEINAPASSLLANANSTASAIGELKIVAEHLQGTLTFSGTRYAPVLPASRQGDTPKKQK